MIVDYRHIIIHHSATSANATIETIKKNWIRSLWTYPAHYVIAKDWSYENIVDIEKRVGWTRSAMYNRSSIQIELIWNFNNNPPTISQYKTLQKILKETEEELGKRLEMVLHRDVSPTQCPWKLVNMDMINSLRELDMEKLEKKNKQSSGTYLGKYKITQYHPWYWSPINDNKAQGWSYNVTASWLPLINKYAGKMWACPPELSIWKKNNLRTVLRVEDIGVFECVDRGGMIKGKRLDLFVGLWKVGYNNRTSWKFLYGNQNKDVYLLYQEKVK